jgi:hypothetical protein
MRPRSSDTTTVFTRRRLRLCAVALILVAAVIGPAACSSPNAGDGDDASPSPAPTDAAKLAETAFDAMTAGGLSVHVSSSGGEIAVTDVPGIPGSFDVVTLDGEIWYVKFPDFSGWTPIGDKTAFFNLDLRRYYRALQASAIDMDIVRTEAVAGVLCDVVEMEVDAARLEAREPASRLAESLAKVLDLDPPEVAAALDEATMTYTVWIARDDSLPRREVSNVVADLGDTGRYEQHDESYYDSYGAEIEPPIAMPSPIMTAPPSAAPQT